MFDDVDPTNLVVCVGDVRRCRSHNDAKASRSEELDLDGAFDLPWGIVGIWVEQI